MNIETTAKSNLSNFYPEWISQIRYVSNPDPNNPDVIYNKGHFLHQLNLFVGPVNYYYEINGKKICKEMNTGDTSYISPYVKHSFTTRDKYRPAYIVAVTTGSSLKRNQNELRMFGKYFYSELISNKFNYIQKTINQALKNEICSMRDFKISMGQKLVEKIKDKERFKKLSVNELFKVSNFLNISPSNFFYDTYKENQVINRYFKKDEFNFFPSISDKLYRIYKSARSKNFSNLRGFLIEVLSTKKILEL